MGGGGGGPAQRGGGAWLENGFCQFLANQTMCVGLPISPKKRDALHGKPLQVHQLPECLPIVADVSWLFRRSSSLPRSALLMLNESLRGSNVDKGTVVLFISAHSRLKCDKSYDKWREESFLGKSSIARLICWMSLVHNVLECKSELLPVETCPLDSVKLCTKLELCGVLCG